MAPRTALSCASRRTSALAQARSCPRVRSATKQRPPANERRPLPFPLYYVPSQCWPAPVVVVQMLLLLASRADRKEEPVTAAGDFWATLCPLVLGTCTVI